MSETPANKTVKKTVKKTGHTAAQVIAADPAQSVWVSANAGTGKTHVLIERILRLLLSGSRPGKILCLTFTKAAAAEVANRLSLRLGHWAAMDDAALSENLESLLGKPASEKETATARGLFADTLEAPEGLRIRTVHSFSESLLSRFPVEAGIAPHFSVIDERRAGEIRTEARDRILSHEGSRPAAVTDALAHLAGLVDQDRFAALMKELDSKRGVLRHLMQDSGGPGGPGGINGLIARTRRTLGLAEGETPETVLAKASQDGGAFDRKALKAAAGALEGGTKTDQDRAAKILTWLALDAPRRADSFAAGYAPVFVTQKQEPRAETSLITKKVKEAHPDALAALLAEQARVVGVLETLKAVAMADATESLLVVGTALIGAYEGIKKSRALLDYDDLIDKAERLLAGDGGVSWVHYKLDGGIDHILVDEAQDTSPAQWNVISGLAGDFFTGLGAGEDRPGPRTVFAVGDEKQSIYSFQGADPARFSLMRDHFQEREAALGRRLPEVELEVSYRSVAAVLSVVDDVFAAPDAADGLTWDGKAIRHNTNRPGQGGVVELWPVLSPEEAPETSPWDAPFDRMAPQSPPVRMAEKIAGQIGQWLDGGEILDSAARPIRPGDVMILVRTRGAFAEEMVRALKRRHIPVTGRDRLVLTEHLAVMDLMAAGRFALLPEDDLTLASVLKGPFIELDEETLFTLAHGRAGGRPGTLWRALRDRRGETAEFSRAFDILSGLLAAADFTPPYEFFSGLLGPKGARRDLLAHLGLEAGEPIDEFLGLALDFERDHEPSLEGFLYWLERGEAEIKREMERGRNEVRVLTVHGAKGLEAPVVFLPDTCTLPAQQLDPRTHWRGDGEKPDFVLWRTSKDEEETVSRDMHAMARLEIEREYRRLLYVAMTRARDRLYVCGWEGKNGRTNGCWYDLIEPAMKKIGAETAHPAGEPVLRYSKPQKQKPDGAGPVAAEPETPDPLPGWASAPPAPEPQPSRPLAPSRPSGEDPPVMSPLAEDDGKRFQRGLLVHRLLQSLPDLPRKERPAAAKRFLSRPALGLSPEELGDILTETLGVMDHADHAALFGPGSMAEVPLTGVIKTGGGAKGGESHVLAGQVDRLLVTDDAVTVIDYKTNRPPPETEDAVDPAYLRQMAAYREVLREIYPDRPVRAVLLWTVGPRMMTLGDELLDAHAP